MATTTSVTLFGKLKFPGVGLTDTEIPVAKALGLQVVTPPFEPGDKTVFTFKGFVPCHSDTHAGQRKTVIEEAMKPPTPVTSPNGVVPTEAVLTPTS